MTTAIEVFPASWDIKVDITQDGNTSTHIVKHEFQTPRLFHIWQGVTMTISEIPETKENASVN